MIVTLPPAYAKVPELRRLADQGIECDQILAEAIRRASKVGHWNESNVLFHIAVLSSRVTTGVDVVEAVRSDYLLSAFMGLPSVLTGMLYYGDDYSPNGGMSEVLFKTKGEFSSPTLTTNDFIHRLVAEAVKGDGIQEWRSRPRIHDFILDLLPDRRPERLSDDPRLVEFVHSLSSLVDRADDVEFILALDPSGRLCVRPTGMFGDFAQKGDLGLLIPTRAMIVHHQTFGSFTVEQIAELEDLINGPKDRETDLQNFFERYPHFFRHWDHRAVHPHVYLTREEDGDGPLIPDFILTNRDAQQAFVVDLKLPGEKLIVRKRNRDRFSAAVIEAKAQLLEYRDWFDNKFNRNRVKKAVGMEIYRPQIAVVIGRSTEFRDELDRQRLRAHEPEIEVVTYDDILGYAKKRLLLTGVAWPPK